MNLPFTKRKPTSIHGINGPTAASTAYASAMSGFWQAHLLAEEGRIEEAADLYVRTASAEEEFLWGNPYTPEQKAEIREAYIRCHTT